MFFLGDFFIENVHLKNTKEFTLYSDNTEREKKKGNESGEREILLPRIWGNTMGYLIYHTLRG